MAPISFLLNCRSTHGATDSHRSNRSKRLSSPVPDPCPGVAGRLADSAGLNATWNPGVEQILGFKEHEWIGQSGDIIFLPEDRARGAFQEELRTARQQGYAIDVRWHMRKDGSRVFVDGILQALRDGNGTLLGFAKVMKDATDRKRAEEERDRFFQLGVEMLAVAGADGRFQKVSPTWTEVLGWSDLELTSIPWLDFVHPDDREATAGEIKAALRAGSTVEFENRCRAKSGEYRWMAWKARGYPDEQLLYAAATDATERRRTAGEREQMLRERARRAAEWDAIFRQHTGCDLRRRRERHSRLQSDRVGHARLRDARRPAAERR